MNKEEKLEFRKIAISFDRTRLDLFEYNWYEVLGLKPFEKSDEHFNDIIKKHFNDRRDYVTSDIKDSNEKTNARNCINKARTELKKPEKKVQYDKILRPKLENKLKKLIIGYVKIDGELDEQERKDVEKTGKEFGFTDNDTKQIIKELKNRKEYKFKEVQSKQSRDEFTRTTKTGSPILKMEPNKTKLVFDKVKLNETRSEVISITNGGGGTLDVTAKSSKNWIVVTPKKIHQKKLPQDVTIKINPRKDKSLKNGSVSTGTLSFTSKSYLNSRKLISIEPIRKRSAD